MKERYGQGYKIATALVECLINGPPIKNEHCNAPQKLSISLTNCKNILQDVGYVNKVDNPDSPQKIVRRLPHTLRRSWRNKADAITNNEHREIAFHDLVKLVDAKARAMTHPVFGDIKDDPRIGRKDSKGSTNRRGANFATSVNDGGRTDSTMATRLPPKCPFCNGHHVLVRCKDFKKLRVEQRFRVSALTASFQAISCVSAPGQVFVRFLDVSPNTPRTSTHREIYENLRREY